MKETKPISVRMAENRRDRDRRDADAQQAELLRIRLRLVKGALLLILTVMVNILAVVDGQIWVLVLAADVMALLSALGGN